MERPELSRDAVEKALAALEQALAALPPHAAEAAEKAGEKLRPGIAALRAALKDL
ncbi:MAG: hypothetical protein AB7M12_12990 [Hyphomonadaceae bacterium]